MYRSAKRDKNEPRIRRFFERCGASVYPLDDPGCADLLVGINNFTLLVEVKSDKGKLTPRQEAFFKMWKGQAAVVRNYKDAKEVLRKLNMPTYIYKCESCGERITVIQSMFDEPLQTHENCGGKVTRLIIHVPVVVYRGDGWTLKKSAGD